MDRSLFESRRNTMPSPFPGMNPYLEQEDAWHDFHERFLPLAAEVLGAQVDPNYIVKIDEHVYIHELPADQRRLLGRADVGVARSPVTAGGLTTTGVLDPPAQVQLPPVDIERLSYVEIRDRHSRQLITVLELLSPSNKQAGPDRDQYLAKRFQLLASNVHFVELDLLRGGPRLPITNLPDCDYYALVSRVENRPWAGVWPIRLRDRLPTIPIPLRAPDGNAQLDLQDLLHRIYDAARYKNYIYEGQPQPRLSSEDAAWAQQFVPLAS
jgi:hypothetical protein